MSKKLELDRNLSNTLFYRKMITIIIGCSISLRNENEKTDFYS